MAYDQGALIALNSDARSRKGLHMIEYGVATARRAWLTAESVVNCYPLERLMKVLSKEKYRD
jgi:DNA polymerase (family 10)